MKRLGYCWPCHEAGRLGVPAVELIDGDPHCAACASCAVYPETPVKAVSPKAFRPCTRGCGKPTHRGRCAAGRVVLPALAHKRVLEMPRRFPQFVVEVAIEAESQEVAESFAARIAAQAGLQAQSVSVRERAA